MAVFYDLWLVSLAVLMLASQLDSASAAVRVYGLHARGLVSDDPFEDFQDPYVKVWCGSTFGGQTEVLDDNNRPTWSAQFSFPNCNRYDILKLEVWDRDPIYDDLLARCTIKMEYGTTSFTCYGDFGSLFFKYEMKQ